MDENRQPRVNAGWWEQLVRRLNADRNQFMLDFNIRDLVFVPEQPPETPEELLHVDEYLTDQLIQSDAFDFILGFSLTTGIRLLDDKANNSYEFKRPPDASKSSRYKALAKDVISSPTNLLDQIDRPKNPEALAHDLDPMRAFLFLDRLLTGKIKKADGTWCRIALVVDYLENLAPARQIGHRDQVLLAETLNRWANSRAIRENRHLIVLLAEDINQVTPALYGGSSGTVNIRIERPDLAQRLAFLRWLAPLYSVSRAEDASTPEELAKLTAGFNLAEIKGLFDFAHKHINGRLDAQLIRERKRDVIRTESRGMLENVETEGVDFSHVGGLEHVKKALKDVSRWLRSDETTRLVPKGMLFVGPPGTGKSLVAQALANESGINMVKLRDVQSQWVGESERNMSRVLDVARAFAPVIVFVDEIDQAYGQRGTGDNTGVSSRLFGKLLEFIGDNANRGKVIWVAASNRPDYVDAALISRFDRVLPFLLPDQESRADILLEAMPKIIGLDWAEGNNREYWSEPSRAAWEELLERTREYSGRELELVVRRGVELANGRALFPKEILEAVRKFGHSHDPGVYQLQTLLALEVTNFEDFMPDPDELEPASLRERIRGKDEDGKAYIDRGEVRSLIASLRQSVR